MRFRGDDALLSMDVVQEGSFVVTVTDGGYAKRTPVEEWSPKGRGILGVRAMRLVEARGGLVGAVVCTVDDQIFAVANDGIVNLTYRHRINPDDGTCTRFVFNDEGLTKGFGSLVPQCASNGIHSPSRRKWHNPFHGLRRPILSLHGGVKQEGKH